MRKSILRLPLLHQTLNLFSRTLKFHQNFIAEMMPRTSQNIRFYGNPSIFLACIVIVLQVFEPKVKGNDQLSNNPVHLKRPGPIVYQTNENIWPKPQLQTKNSEIFFTLNASDFSFKVCRRNGL